jgi:hypothetical protein
VATATPTLAGGVTATPTTIGAASLPEGSEGVATPTIAMLDTGISLPGLAVFGGGLLMAVIGILLAL